MTDTPAAGTADTDLTADASAAVITNTPAGMTPDMASDAGTSQEIQEIRVVRRIAGVQAAMPQLTLSLLILTLLVLVISSAVNGQRAELLRPIEFHPVTTAPASTTSQAGPATPRPSPTVTVLHDDISGEISEVLVDGILADYYIIDTRPLVDLHEVTSRGTRGAGGKPIYPPGTFVTRDDTDTRLVWAIPAGETDQSTTIDQATEIDSDNRPFVLTRKISPDEVKVQHRADLHNHGYVQTISWRLPASESGETLSPPGRFFLIYVPATAPE